MEYMTFNSSCSYAGVANMLAQYEFSTNDRAIATDMKLPYLFAYENGVYLAGPMLQSARWFNLYLHPKGFHMSEREVPAELVPEYLKQQKTAMLGVQTEQGGKHAIVYTGTHRGQLRFLNNKWAQDPAPEELLFTDAELLTKIDPVTVIATLEQISPWETDLSQKLGDSVSVLRRNLCDIREVCSKPEAVSSLRANLNTLFRPLLLDGITMLGLLGEEALAARFTAIQRSFLTALGQEADTVITLGDFLPVGELTAAAECYIQLILNELN